MSEPVAWTFVAGGELAEQLEWETDILQAETGPTQARRLRSLPRVQLRMDGLEDLASRRWLESLLWHHGAGQWLAPLAMDARQLAIALPAESTEIATETDYPRFAAGGHALLQGEGPRSFEVVEIESVDDGLLTLAAETQQDWPAGTRISPLRVGRFVSLPSLSRFTSDASGVFQAQFRLEEPIEATPDPGEAAYRGYPVLEWRPVWVSDPTWAPERTVVAVDEGVAPPAVFDLVRQARDRVALQFALESLPEIHAFRGLLYALGGRWAPVWVPTWAQDVRVVATVGAGSSVLDIEGPLLSAFPLASNRRDLRIELLNGTVLYRRVTSATAHTFTVDRLTVDSPFPDSFSPGEVAIVSFLALSRQDSDINVLRYFNWHTAQCELVFKGEVHAL